MSSWLPLIIILLAVALVVGPVMWMKPSSRDKRLASLRSRAAAAGITVEMQALPEALGQGSAAVYFGCWRDMRRLQLGWALEQQRLEHEMHFSGRWDWRNGQAAPAAAWEPLKELLERLPADACALVASRHGLGIQWRETGGDGSYRALESALAEFRPVIEEAIRQPKPVAAKGDSGE